MAEVTLEANKLEYYTKVRNYLFDAIIQEVTTRCKQGKTAALILFLIERKAAGFHNVKAKLSIPDMESFTNASRSDVKRARSWLIAEGYIEVLLEGNGLKTSELRIVLDPQERVCVRGGQEDRNELIAIQPEDKPAKIISREEESSCPGDNQSLTPDIHAPVSARTESERNSDPTHCEESTQTADSGAVEPHQQTPDPTPESSSRIFQYQSALNPNKIKGVLTDPSSRASDDPGLTVLKKETNIEYQREAEQKKAAFGSVCSFVNSQNVKMEDRDYAFAKWTVKTYGAEVVSAKMQIAKFQSKRGVKFANPLGWLRNALTRDYQPAKFDGEVLKARENARRQRERSERERAEAEQERQKWEGYRDHNPDAARQAYAAFLSLVDE